MDEDSLTDWLKDHWGHEVMVKEDLGDGEYHTENLNPVEVEG